MSTVVQAQARPRRTVAGFFYVISATILWSISPICIKLMVKSMEAFALGWIRFAAGTVILFAISKARKRTMALGKHDFGLAAVAGIALGLNHTLYIKGVEHTTAAASGVIVQLEVILLVILGYLFLKDRIGPLKGAGIALALAGVLVAAWNGADSLKSLLASDNLRGNLLLVVSSPLWAVYGIMQKKLNDRGVSVSTSTLYIFAMAQLVTMPAAIASHGVHGPLDLKFWGTLAVFVVLATVGANGMMAKGFDALDASTAGAIASFFPIITIANAWVFLGERPTAAMWMGGALVMAGILIIGITETRDAAER